MARAGATDDEDGTAAGPKGHALDRVGIYVPGGKAAYPSSVLMNAIPAHVAGVGEIIMVVPHPGGGVWGGTGARGERNPLVLARGLRRRVTRVFTIGGAQAIGAWPSAPRRYLRSTRSPDRETPTWRPRNGGVRRRRHRHDRGPSEILVLADGTTPADWVAMDLFSQAEHDELAQSILLCPDAAYLTASRRQSSACCRDGSARASSHARSMAAEPWCIRAAWRRPAISATGLRRSIWRSAAAIRTGGSLGSNMPVRFFWAPSPARVWATTAPVRTTYCLPAPPRVSRVHWACTIFRNAPA